MKNRLFSKAGLLTICLFVTVSVFSQTTKTPSIDKTPQTQVVVSTDGDYLIGSNDVLEIRIDDAPELTGNYQVSSSGHITLPVAGRIEAKGKSPEKVKRIIADRLKGNYLVNPIVTVRVSQSNSRAFFIQGAVVHPGMYQIEGKVSLLKLISIAGGLTKTYGSTAFVMRELANAESRQDDMPGKSAVGYRNNYKLIKVNVDRLLRGELNRNLEIRSGDIVHIPRSEEFFVAGKVRNPGSFPLNKATTLQQAISRAGGLAEGSGSVAFLMREKDERSQDADGDDFEIIEINISELFNGRLNRRILIKPRDFINITAAGVYYVAGEVKAPGSFQMAEDGITIRQAITRAKGVNFEGDLRRSVILRQNGSGKRTEIAIDIAAIMKGEAEDVAIRRNDILVVPNSKSRSIQRSIFRIFTNSLPVILSRGIIR